MQGPAKVRPPKTDLGKEILAMVDAASPELLEDGRRWYPRVDLDALSPTDRREWLLVFALRRVVEDVHAGRRPWFNPHRLGEAYAEVMCQDLRKRTGAFYTPEHLAARIVRRTLEPVLLCLGGPAFPDPEEPS